MNCPFCSRNKDRVVDSRESRDGATVRRRRECLECGRRFTTYEQIEDIPYLVVKTDGDREEFNRADALELGRKGTVGFALTILQRRLASSPEAIYQSLRRRRERLEKRLREEQLQRRGADARIATPDELPALSLEDLDELDEAPESEISDVEEHIVDQASAAQTIAELQAEIQILQRLPQLHAQAWIAKLAEDLDEVGAQRGHRSGILAALDEEPLGGGLPEAHEPLGGLGTDGRGARARDAQHALDGIRLRRPGLLGQGGSEEREPREQGRPRTGAEGRGSGAGHGLLHRGGGNREARAGQAAAHQARL